MTIRAVLFDLDDTLTDDDASVRESLAGTAAQIAVRCPGLSPRDIAEAYWRESSKVWDAFAAEQEAGRPREEGTGDRLRRESWGRALQECGIEDDALVRRAVDVYGRLRETTLHLAPGADEVLDALRRLVRTAIITNGAAEMQRAKLRKFGLERRVDYSIVSEEFGYGKPNPAIFLHVAHVLDAAAGECMMVGDNVGLDIIGASAAGMRSAWLNRGSRALLQGAPSPDFVIGDIREMLDIVLQTKSEK
jgi:putative hydrolase of the HAD superfamily